MEYSAETVVAIILVAFLIIFFGGLPGFIARRRRQPNAAAITVCGYFGLIFFPAWIVAIVWSLMGEAPKKKRRRR